MNCFYSLRRFALIGIMLIPFIAYAEWAPPLTAQQIEACLNRGGVPKTAHCANAYSDAGKACSDSEECEGRCISIQHMESNTIASGICEADDNDIFECKQEIIKNRTGHVLCAV